MKLSENEKIWNGYGHGYGSNVISIVISLEVDW